MFHTLQPKVAITPCWRLTCFDECFTLFAKLEPSEASWSLLLERNCRQSVMLVFGETLRGGKAHPILGRPRLAEAGQGRPRLAKAGQGWPRLAKALLLQSAKLSSTFGLRPLILKNVCRETALQFRRRKFATGRLVRPARHPPRPAKS